MRFSGITVISQLTKLAQINHNQTNSFPPFLLRVTYHACYGFFFMVFMCFFSPLGVRMELTPTMHGAMIRVTFPQNSAMGQQEDTERRFCFAEAQVSWLICSFLVSLTSCLLSFLLSSPLAHQLVCIPYII
jgi:ABC-type glycerol-3-phosphate transport system permease component